MLKSEFDLTQLGLFPIGIPNIRILEMDYFFSDINGQIFQSITSIFRKCLGSLKKIEVGVSKWKVKYKENCASKVLQEITQAVFNDDLKLYYLL